MEKAKKKPDADALRVLILEDVPSDAELVQRALRRAGIPFSARVTKNRREFSAALARFLPQVILSDFKLPGFDGMAALALAHARAPEIPFIFVSGSIGEEKAIACLSQGAADYVFKDNLARLGPALKRVLAEAETRRQKAEAENSLRESEEKYRTLVTQSPDGIFIIDLQGNFLSVNQAMCTGLGYGEEELLSMNLRDVVPEKYLGLHKKRLAGIMKGKPQNDAAEYEVKAKDGKTRHISILSAPYFRNNQLIGLLGIARDITEKMEMETRLRASEEFHRTLVETSPDAVVTIDGGGRITFTSHKALDLFAVPGGGDVLGASVLDFVDPADAARVQERLIEILSGSSLPEIRAYRLRRWDKEPFWAEIISAPLRDNAGRNIGLLLICRDISERRRIETALRESEEKYRLIAENTAETITVLDLNLNLTYVSPSIIRLRGYTVEEVLRQTLPEILTPDSLAKIQQVFAEETALEQSGKADPTRSRTLELQEYHRDGSVIWVENTISFLRDKEGNPIGFLAVAKDISERKQAELEQRKLLDIIENSLNEIYLFDAGTLDFEYVNQGALGNLGYTLDEMKRLTPLAIKPRFKEAEFRKLLQPLIDGEKDKLVFDTIHRRKDGSDYPVEIHLQLFKQEDRSVFFAVINDNSERKMAEEMIKSSLREKEVLLQEIHHRVKNNLQIVSGLLTLQADHAAAKSVDEMFQESQDRIRSIALVHESLYKSHNLAEIAFDDYLRVLVDNLVTSHFAAAGRVDVQYDMERILLTIETAIPLGLIVNELVSNSLKHAFPGGRRGQIRVQLQGGDKERFVGVKTKSGTLYRVPTCELTVADNGIGLPAGFELAGQKTLGFQILSMLARQMNGELTVRGGAGTEWHIIIPAQPLKTKAHEAKT